jgi:hypothetical protein
MEDRIVHSQPIDAVVQNVRTDLDNGLTREDARDRLQKFGLNELTERPRPGFLALLWDQFNNYLVIILIVAAVIAALLGEYVDALAIMCIVILNAIIGVVQESKAEQALAALKKMAAPNAQVIRDGQQLTVPARELVPGASSSWRRATTYRPICVSSRASTSRSRKPHSPGNRCRWKSRRRWCWTATRRWATAGTAPS